MKIAFLITTFPRLSETFILNQITGLIDLGHQVDIYAEKLDVTDKTHPEVEKYRLLERTSYMKPFPSGINQKIYEVLSFFTSQVRKGNFSAFSLFKGLKRRDTRLAWEAIYRAMTIETKQSYDVILCHFGLNGISGMALREAGFLDGKLATVFHGFDVSTELNRLGHNIYDSLFKKGDVFLPISEHWQEKLITLGCQPEQINVHHMAVDCKHFNFAPRQPDENGQVRLVSVCRLAEKKGIEYAIRAIAQLPKNDLKLQYQIIGDGELRPHLEQLTADLQLESNIEFLGWKQQHEVIEILQNSHILLAPSVTSATGDKEGIPVAIMEAMAMGMPVVSTLHSGIPELVKDGEAGLLAPERDEKTLAEKLHYLLANPETWPTMGKAGRFHVEEYFEIKKQNDRLIRTFELLLKDSNAPKSGAVNTSQELVQASKTS